MVQQVFAIFQSSQNLDVQSIVQSIFPTSSDQFVIQASVALNSIVSKVSSASLNFLIGIFLEAPTLLLNFFIICFVFFFALRDNEKLKEFVKDLSPFNQSKEKLIVKSFKDITDAVIYGQIVIGIVQGILTGLGLWFFGVDNVLVLTLLATVLSIAPILGPFLIWVPVAVYLYTTSDPLLASGYVLYNLLIVSAADNLLRTYLISRRTNMSSAIILIGMNCWSELPDLNKIRWDIPRLRPPFLDWYTHWRQFFRESRGMIVNCTQGGLLYVDGVQMADFDMLVVK